MIIFMIVNEREHKLEYKCYFISVLFNELSKTPTYFTSLSHLVLHFQTDTSADKPSHMFGIFKVDSAAVS